jgi:hypothetical protein
MTDEAQYQPLPMPHGRARPTPPAVLIQEGTLPTDLIEQARGRQDEAEVLMLPRDSQFNAYTSPAILAEVQDKLINKFERSETEVSRFNGISGFVAQYRPPDTFN